MDQVPCYMIAKIADPNDPTKLATVIQDPEDPTVYRLQIEGEVNITDSESATKYQLRSDHDVIGDTVTSAADVVLYSVSGISGVLDFVVCAGSSSGYIIAIEIDGTERLRISMSDLSDLGLANATNVDIWAETANKNFRFRPTDVGFTTGFRILARATGANVNVKHLVFYKERVSI